MYALILLYREIEDLKKKLAQFHYFKCIIIMIIMKHAGVN